MNVILFTPLNPLTPSASWRIVLYQLSYSRLLNERSPEGEAKINTFFHLASISADHFLDLIEFE